MQDGVYLFFLGRQYLQEKIICLYHATDQKIGQYFFYINFNTYYITDKKGKKSNSA